MSCTKLLLAAALLAVCFWAAPAAAGAGCDAAAAACQRQCAPQAPKFDCKEADGAISSSCACVGGSGGNAAVGGEQAQQAGANNGNNGARLSGDSQSDTPTGSGFRNVPTQQVSSAGGAAQAAGQCRGAPCRRSLLSMLRRWQPSHAIRCGLLEKLITDASTPVFRIRTQLPAGPPILHRPARCLPWRQQPRWRSCELCRWPVDYCSEAVAAHCPPLASSTAAAQLAGG